MTITVVQICSGWFGLQRDSDSRIFRIVSPTKQRASCDIARVTFSKNSDWLDSKQLARKLQVFGLVPIPRASQSGRVLSANSERSHYHRL